jgi:hypothetical protein
MPSKGSLNLTGIVELWNLMGQTAEKNPFISIEEAGCPYPSYRYLYILTFFNHFS